MKLLILSDLHANFPALEAVWKQESDADAIVCAGDLVDWGFYPHEVVQWCREHGVLSVSGNHDRAIAAAWERWKSGGALPEGTFAAQNLRLLTPEDISYLRALPECRTAQFGDVFCYIRHFYGDDEENRGALPARWIRFESKAAFDEGWPGSFGAGGMRLFITGHSHQSWIYHVCGEDYFVNPGSISYRVCTDSRAKNTDYAVLQDGELRLRHAVYDHSIFAPLLRQSALREDVRDAARYHLLDALPDTDG